MAVDRVQSKPNVIVKLSVKTYSRAQLMAYKLDIKVTDVVGMAVERMVADYDEMIYSSDLVGRDIFEENLVEDVKNSDRKVIDREYNAKWEAENKDWDKKHKKVTSRVRDRQEWKIKHGKAK